MNILTMQGLTIDKVINPLGGLGVTNQYYKLHEDIETLLLTRRGSVIGNPSYGSYLHEILFEPANESTIKRVKDEIRRILLNNYNFISSVDTECTVNNTTLRVSIVYTTLNDNLSTKLEFNIPLASEGGIQYE